VLRRRGGNGDRRAAHRAFRFALRATFGAVENNSPDIKIVR
jgi:hypothetical protein